MANYARDNARKKLSVGGKDYTYYDLQSLGVKDVDRLPYSLKVLLENVLRHNNGDEVTDKHVEELVNWASHKRSTKEIAFSPARVLMQDFTGVPAIVDLAAMRDSVKDKGGDPHAVNPLLPVDLVIDHSVIVDRFGTPGAFESNVELEYKRNGERYAFLRWGQSAFSNFRVVPPGTGICHQVNLENLAQTVWVNDDGIAYPDTVVGTDSHTTMVNGLAVLGWGVGGIEAEASMLGQSISMLIPEVIGFKLKGKLPEGATATDLVLTVTQMLRARGVVNKFVEFYGDGLSALSLADRATIANMAPEYGATCGYFPIDDETLRYLRFTGRDEDRIALVEAYARKQGMFREDGAEDPVFTDTLELDLGTVAPCVAGPKRPHDRVELSKIENSFQETFPEATKEHTKTLKDGDVVIAAITSCTNTSNPQVLIAAGLLARKARQKGLKVHPWVKTSLAPGSQVVSDYLKDSGLQEDLDALGFNLVGYGCTTCIGNSGPLSEAITQDIEGLDLTVASVLSGNRNFEGRVNPHVKANYLASPPLVVAFALAGTVKIDLQKDPVGRNAKGEPIYLKDLWPSQQEVDEVLGQYLTPAMFAKRYRDVFKGDDRWQTIGSSEGATSTYTWDDRSTYVKKPPYFDMGEGYKKSNIKGAAVLALLGDSITTDHISPAGSIKDKSPAGLYLIDHEVFVDSFNSYGARRGNHEVMMRGTLANIRLRNEMVPGVEGGFTKVDGKEMTIFDAAMHHQEKGRPLVIVAGREYGSGSSRDWAAKGVNLLGVKAVLAESFERIHRSNLVRMGVLPLEFIDGMSRKTLALDGTETFDIEGVEGEITPKMKMKVRITRQNGAVEEIQALCRIDTGDEVKYYEKGGILLYVRDQLLHGPQNNQKKSA